MGGLRIWAGRFALIPLIVYAIGTPLELYVHHTISLVADGWLPYEIVGLSICLVLAVQATLSTHSS
jgi:hypothetical protein